MPRLVGDATVSSWSRIFVASETGIGAGGNCVLIVGKECVKCKAFKPLTEFYRIRRTVKDWPQNRHRECAECSKQRTREQRRKDSE